MANDGIIIVIVNLSVPSNKLVGKPIISTRGFVLVNENEKLLSEIEEIAEKTLKEKLSKNINYADLKSEIVAAITPFAFDKTGRKPIVLPVIMEINKKTNTKA